jgi:hypothetical protein
MDKEPVNITAEDAKILEIEKILGFQFQRITRLKLDSPPMITIDKAKDGKWRIIYSGDILGNG